ncbi:MAG: glutamate--tRNA ligase family protein [Gemmataceae bacterium]
MTPVVGRLATSPTGAQHVGNAPHLPDRLAECSPRPARVVVRIEDIDSPRVKAGAAEQAADDLHWLGTDWDGEVVVQTTRLPAYERAARLRAAEQVYPCTCTRSDIEETARRSAPAPGSRGASLPWHLRAAIRRRRRPTGRCRGSHAAGGSVCRRRYHRSTTATSVAARSLHAMGGDFVV